MTEALSPSKPLAPTGIEHFVSTAPFDPLSITRLSPAQEKVYLSSQWQLMWLKFKRHKLAVWSGAFLITVYLIAMFCEIFAPYGSQARNTAYVRAPPQAH